jgi:hypothetical protein
MRRGLGQVTVGAFLILLMTLSTRWDNILGPSYYPRHDLLEWTFTGAAFYLYGTYLFARRAARPMLVRGLFAQLGLFVTALVTWLVYHANSVTPMVQDWDRDVEVMAFHEQLAIPAFIALVAAPLIVLLALRMDRYEQRTLVS